MKQLIIILILLAVGTADAHWGWLRRINIFRGKPRAAKFQPAPAPPLSNPACVEWEGECIPYDVWEELYGN